MFSPSYVFDQILSVFGNDVGENIFTMITFADSNKPPVLEALKEAKVPYSKSFRFNNSALYSDLKEDKDDDNFNELFWNMGITSFKKFFKELDYVRPKSLSLTQEVLKERENLETNVQGLQDQVRMALMKITELEQEERVLEKYKADIEISKDFEYEIETPEINKTQLEPGTFVTNCINCNATCHFPCRIPKDEDKIGCSAMWNGTCTVCVGACQWNMHCNNGYRIEMTSVKKKKTYDELKKRYNDASEQKSRKEPVRHFLFYGTFLS